MRSFEMGCSRSSTQFHQDRVAAKLEELRQAHTSEEAVVSADLEPQSDVVVLRFLRLLKLFRRDGIKRSLNIFQSWEEQREENLSKFLEFDLSVKIPVF